jgi:hypothetical protein
MDARAAPRVVRGGGRIAAAAEVEVDLGGGAGLEVALRLARAAAGEGLTAVEEVVMVREA